MSLVIDPSPLPKGNSLNSDEKRDNSTYDGDKDVEVRRLDEFIGQAKEYIRCFNEKYRSSSHLEESCLAKRIKLGDEPPKMVEAMETSQDEQELDNNGGVSLLAPQAAKTLPSCFTRMTNDDKSLVGEIKIQCGYSLSNHSGCSSDVVDLDEPNEDVSHPQQVEMECGCTRFDECLCKNIKDELFVNPENNDLEASDGYGPGVVDERDQKDDELINLGVSQLDLDGRLMVERILELLDQEYKRLSHENLKARNEETYGKQIHLMAYEHLKPMQIDLEKPFGRIPGIEIGDEFHFRTELAMVGIHNHLVWGIDYVVRHGKKFATSIVNSGRYKNEAKAHGVLIYCGQGGKTDVDDKATDQKLVEGNLALVNSKILGYPIRFTIKKTKSRGNSSNYVYAYDGLYTIQKSWRERDTENGKLIYKFELHKMAGQSRPPGLSTLRPVNAKFSLLKVNAKSTLRQVNAKSRESSLLVNDLAEQKEKRPIHAINRVDDSRPQAFHYKNNVVYPDWLQLSEPEGCDCINGCSDSEQCACIMKNEGELPFNDKRKITRARPVVHECGPSCKCPPTCMNRVSQLGLQYDFIVFKTKSTGWGLQSRNFIPSGSFICEYAGEFLSDEEAGKRVGNDEYLFNIDDCKDGGGFVIDAKGLGNIGRFINHSCSPNLCVQKVLYDHDDMRIPHIMFFASKNIPPSQELTYDYSYNGNIKVKECFCGSSKCKGMMY